MLLVVPLRPADLASRKQAGLPISVLTAWDALSAAVVTEAGADAILVGDSLAMVVLATAPPCRSPSTRCCTTAVPPPGAWPLQPRPSSPC